MFGLVTVQVAIAQMAYGVVESCRIQAEKEAEEEAIMKDVLSADDFKQWKSERIARKEKQRDRDMADRHNREICEAIRSTKQDESGALFRTIIGASIIGAAID